jgi:hypothetical protein
MPKWFNTACIVLFALNALGLIITLAFALR